MIKFWQSKPKKTVFVGLSGGVDSSVAAKRLIDQGYKVVGVFIKVWQPDFLECNWEAERLDAMRVAAHLKIPFLTCDAEAAYRQEVGDYFVSEYLKGRTPNPDVMCNQAVKFGAFLRFAKERKADFVATGHYAKLEAINGVYKLLRGVDTNKDQSYFLWTLTQAQLKNVLLPIGDTIKDQIRQEATKAKLPTAIKKDSQGVCFLGHIDIPEFLSHFTELKPGDVLNETGEIIGIHKGALVYTLGQRHGFTTHTRENHTEPLYVIKKNLMDNTIIVANKPPKIGVSESIPLGQVNWISELPKSGEYEAQFRYRQKPLRVWLDTTTEGVTTLKLLEEGDRPAPGQSCVIYRNDQCLGGGIIES